jgi:glycosyltransferase involved in cell wall biosynthesis
MASGGAQKLLSDYLTQTKNDGNEHFLILLNNRSNRFLFNLDKQSINILQSRRISLYSPLHLIDIFLKIRKEFPDIVHVHLFPAFYYVSIISTCFPDIKFVMTEHNTTNRRRAMSFTRPLEKFIYAKFSAIINISEEVKFQLVEWIGSSNNFFTIFNSIDLEKFKCSDPSSIRDELKIKQSDILVIMVARLTPQKNHELLLESLTMLESKFKLLIVGEGDKYNNLYKIVNQLDLRDRVFFLGFRSDIASLYKASDVAVLSSHYEGFGISAIEALATGIPLIVTNTPGLTDVVGKFAIKLSTNTPDEMAKSILMASKKHFNFTQEELNSHLSKYSIKQFIGNMNNLYQKISNIEG